MENQDSGTGRIRAHYKVLLVEDNPTLQMIQKTFLEMAGCEVEITDKGREARTLTQASTYDCVFLDLGLPDVAARRGNITGLSQQGRGCCPNETRTSRSVGGARPAILQTRRSVGDAHRAGKYPLGNAIEEDDSAFNLDHRLPVQRAN